MNPTGSKHETSNYCCSHMRWMANFDHASNEPCPARTGIKHRRICIRTSRGTSSLWSACDGRDSDGIGDRRGGKGRDSKMVMERGSYAFTRVSRPGECKQEASHSDCCILHATVNVFWHWLRVNTLLAQWSFTWFSNGGNSIPIILDFFSVRSILFY